MITPELTAYISSELRRGIAPDVIRASLARSGWNGEDISGAFGSHPAYAQTPRAVMREQPAVISEIEYPVQISWVFKSFIPAATAILVSVAMALFGYYNAYLILIVLYAPIQFVVLLLRRQNFHFFIDNQHFIVSQGVLNKQQRTIAYGVIQNVFVKQDLFDRIFGLASVAVENASESGGAVSAPKKFFGLPIAQRTPQQAQENIGFTGNQVMIPGLYLNDAEALKTVLLAKIKANPLFDTRSGL